MMELRKLTNQDISDCRALWQARFFDSNAFCDWYFKHRFCPELSVGLFEDGKLCSMAHGRKMQIHYNNTILSALMVGGVSTATSAEGHGYMKRVMAEMEKIGIKEDVDLLLLATERPALYKSSGYEVCAKALYATATGEDIQPLNYDKENYPIQELLSCGEHACGTLPFFPARTESYMKNRVDELCCEGAGLLMLRNAENVLTGYAFADLETNRADEVIAYTTEGYRKLLSQLPKGMVAMLPPQLEIEGERDSCAWTMCKPLKDHLKIHMQLSKNTERMQSAFCPETY